jgi:general secretion pathway protein G
MRNPEKTKASFSRIRNRRAMDETAPLHYWFAMGKRGFTLIELIIVVGLIGVLITIAIPTYNDFVLKAKQANAKSDVRTLESAISAYMVEQNKLPLMLTDIGKAADIKDPWKQSYQYFNIEKGTGSAGPQYQDYAGNNLNDDFDLYSLGADHLTAHYIDTVKNNSSDDIVRATSGSNVVLGSDY